MPGQPYLQQPGLQGSVNENVEPEQLVAVLRVWHVHVHSSNYLGLNGDERLDNQVVHAGPQRCHVHTIFRQPIP